VERGQGHAAEAAAGWTMAIHAYRNVSAIAGPSNPGERRSARDSKPTEKVHLR